VISIVLSASDAHGSLPHLTQLGDEKMGKRYEMSLSDRLENLATFEQTIAKVAKSSGKNVPSKVALNYKVDEMALSKEADALLQKYGEVLQGGHMKAVTQLGFSEGAWTCLVLNSKTGSICDPSNNRTRGLFDTANFKPTMAWDEAPATSKVLSPIQSSLLRVRYSIMRPWTMVSWHCDDCPYRHTAKVCDRLKSGEEAIENPNWQRYHRWVRLHRC